MAEDTETSEHIDTTDKQEEAATKVGAPDSTNKRKAEWKEVDDEKNTSVYVSGLPLSITEEEFIDLMNKYGVIAKRPIPGEPFNVKLYKHQDGSLKGDALCKYHRKESVQLAVNILDGYHYDDKHIIHCEKAKFEPKASFDPSKKPRIDPNVAQKQRKQMNKMMSWAPEASREYRQKKVVLKRMFDIQELADDPTLILKLRDDLELRCTRELEVKPKRVDVYDTNPDGVIVITFAEADQAEACVYSFRRHHPCLDAELWDGKTKFKIKETEEEAEERLKKFEQDIQGDDKPEVAGDSHGTSPKPDSARNQPGED